MSDNKERKVEDIQSEYGQLCTKAGHLQYQIYALSKDLALVNEQLRELNFEASKVISKTPKEGA